MLKEKDPTPSLEDVINSLQDRRTQSTTMEPTWFLPPTNPNAGNVARPTMPLKIATDSSCVQIVERRAIPLPNVMQMMVTPKEKLKLIMWRSTTLLSLNPQILLIHVIMMMFYESFVCINFVRA